MAVFYERIKGINQDGQIINIKFLADKLQLIKDMDDLQTTVPPEKDCGYLLSTKTNANITAEYDFNKGIKIGEDTEKISLTGSKGILTIDKPIHTDTINSNTITLVGEKDSLKIGDTSLAKNLLSFGTSASFSNEAISVPSGTFSTTVKVDDSNKLTTSGLTAKTASIGITDSTEQNLTVNGNAKITGNIEADFFNATSDKRVKTNIKPITINVLDFINQLQVYSYNYTFDKNKEPIIGVMAQDLLPLNLNEFNFVNNPNAKGTEDDYMSIKESKLVFLLLKAIQEQQKEINELKEKISK